MNLNLLTKRMAKSATAMIVAVALLIFAGAATSAQAEVTTPVKVDSKAVQITNVGNFPFVLDDKGNGWGISVSSRAFRMSLLPYPAHLEKVDDMSKIVSIISNDGFGIALKEDGTVWTVEYVESSTNAEKDKWGLRLPKLVAQVPHLEHIVKINFFYGNIFTAVDQNEKMWIWEDIPSSSKTEELKPYFSDLQEEPILVSGIDHIKDVISPSTILKDDGTVWTWECNLRAACDMLSAPRSNNPVQIQGLTDIVKLGQGFSYDHIALKKDGTVWIWGAGYLSNPKFDGSGKEDPPSQINGLSDIVDISVGGNHILALKKDGTVWSIGYFPRDYKFLSNTIALENYRPLAQVEGLTDVTAVFSGDQTDAVIKKDGSLWLWGYDSQGLFGSDNMTLQLSPVQVELKPSPEIPRR